MISADAIKRRWLERGDYASCFDWLKSIYSRWLRRTKLPLPFRGRTSSLRLKCSSQPFHFRFGTTDLLVLEEIFLKGEYDMLRSAATKPPHIIVDLGANVGYSVRFWLSLFPEARIIAVEPDPRNAELCLRNCDTGIRTGKVQVFQACVRSFDGDTFLNTSGDEWAYSAQNTPGSSTVPVKACTLDQILEKCGVEGQVDLLKCDIEGGERELFQQPGEWLRNTATLIVEVHAPYSLERLQLDLERAGSPRPVIAKGKSSLVALLGEAPK